MYEADTAGKGGLRDVASVPSCYMCPPVPMETRVSSPNSPVRAMASRRIISAASRKVSRSGTRVQASASIYLANDRCNCSGISSQPAGSILVSWRRACSSNRTWSSDSLLESAECTTCTSGSLPLAPSLYHRLLLWIQPSSTVMGFLRLLPECQGDQEIHLQTYMVGLKLRM